MGYSHYWKTEKPLEISNDQKILLGYILQDHKGIVDQTEAPEFETKEHLVFLNGIGEASHETFAISRKAMEFEFCKTARKPYDIVVCKMLLILSLSDGFSFSSDGIYLSDDNKVVVDEEWNPAIEWFDKMGFKGKETIEKMIKT